MKANGSVGWAAVDPVAAENSYHLGGIMRLEVGDSIFTQNGDWVRVESIVYRPGTIHTYSFKLVNQDAPNYFANGCLAHNTDYACRALCFPSNTMVQMADGTSKEIQQINVGDKVLSYDPATGSYATSVVLSVKGSPQTVYSLNNGLLRLTESHPLYVKKPNGEVCWAAINPERAGRVYGVSNVKQLEIGDQLYIGDNGWDTVVYSIMPESIPVATYTLRLSDPNTFFANGVLAYGLTANSDAHTIHENYAQLAVVYKVYDSESPVSRITNRDELKTIYYNPDSITFEWTGTDDVTETQNLVYKYRLDPNPYPNWQPGGNDMSKWTTDTSVTITKDDFDCGFFPRGNYTFRVRAYDESGKVETNETSYNTWRFAVYPANVTVNVNVNQGETETIALTNATGDPVNLDSDFILLELSNGSTIFARVWLFDFTSLTYTFATSVGSYGVSFENGAITYTSPGGSSLWKGPSITTENNRIILRFLQVTTPDSFSVGGSDVSCRVSSRLVENTVREQSNVYLLHLQVFGEQQDAWRNYLENFDGFSEDGDTLVYPVGSSGINVLMVHTIVEMALKS
ncbi:MAG TPA: hypothetical protein ENL13_01575 [Thermoplasmatales archaeon]|nr:hypothetical protein [Thermoplasmatales archaeon]